MNISILIGIIIGVAIMIASFFMADVIDYMGNDYYGTFWLLGVLTGMVGVYIIVLAVIR